MAIFSNPNISSLKVQSYDRELNKYKIFRRLFIVSFFVMHRQKGKEEYEREAVVKDKNDFKGTVEIDK